MDERAVYTSIQPFGFAIVNIWVGTLLWWMRMFFFPQSGVAFSSVPHEIVPINYNIILW